MFANTLWGSLLLSVVLSISAAEAAPSDLTFEQYLDMLQQQALAEGVSDATVSAIFPQIKLFKKASFNLEPPSIPLTLEQHLDQVTSTLIEQSRSLYQANKAQFDRLGARYGVQPRFVIALWGLTSKSGDDVGHYPILAVTASNAYHGDNAAENRQAFIDALKVIERKQIDFNALMSNALGKMGYAHFSPSDYDRFGQDADDDGIIDIWHNLNDAFASTAYYLKQLGWNDQQTWGRQVQVPKAIPLDLIGIETRKSFAQWQALGVKRFDGTNLPNKQDMQVSLIMPDGIKGRKYLVYDNYRALTQWNASDYYLLSLTYLSERIKYPAIQ